jgi:hypothetical protein
MNKTITNNSDLKGCFWNPKAEKLNCVVSHTNKTFQTTECLNSMVVNQNSIQNQQNYFHHQ